MFKFLKKCKHDYELIGKYYIEQPYANAHLLNAIEVYKCKSCGKIYQKTLYAKDLHGCKLSNVHDEKKYLEKHGFVSELEYKVKELE